MLRLFGGEKLGCPRTPFIILLRNYVIHWGIKHYEMRQQNLHPSDYRMKMCIFANVYYILFNASRIHEIKSANKSKAPVNQLVNMESSF